MNKFLMFWVLLGYAQSLFGNMILSDLMALDDNQSIQNLRNEKMKRIVYRQGNYGSICFTPKKSCEFATEECLEKCTERYVDTSWSDRVFASFQKETIIKLYATIKKEMDTNGYKLLFWFDCGDCPVKLTSKISSLMEQLNEDKIIQIGFTRNKVLWKKVKDLKNMRFMLSVEKGSKITEEGYYAIPDYDNERAAIFHYHTFSKLEDESIDKALVSGKAFIRYCGGGYSYIEHIEVTEPEMMVGCPTVKTNTAVIKVRDDVHEANCQYCYEGKHGCFSKTRKNNK